jgi:ADP-ribose pyrophosphatase
MSIWETLSSRYLWQSRWYKLRQDQVRTQDGHEFTYTIIDHPGAVWVVPVTAEGQVILIRHYRYTVDDWCYEVPAGGLPSVSSKAGLPHLSTSSSLAQAEEMARRELLEDVGGTATDLQHVGHFYTTNGISNETAYVYLATGVELGETSREPAELMETYLVSLEEAMRMAREGEISDGPSALALLWCGSLLQQDM